MHSHSSNPTVALLVRNSTEDQAERETIKNQITFLRKFVELHDHPVYDIYSDEGVSGTLLLEERPDGRRLLADAAAGCFRRVIVYRLDRLGRSIRALLNAHDRLEALGITIQSATEPFDTSS